MGELLTPAKARAIFQRATGFRKLESKRDNSILGVEELPMWRSMWFVVCARGYMHRGDVTLALDAGYWSPGLANAWSALHGTSGDHTVGAIVRTPASSRLAESIDVRQVFDRDVTADFVLEWSTEVATAVREFGQPLTQLSPEQIIADIDRFWSDQIMAIDTWVLGPRSAYEKWAVCADPENGVTAEMLERLRIMAEAVLDTR
jgi:hypothetical protein